MGRKASTEATYLLAGAVLCDGDIERATAMYREQTWRGALEGWPIAVFSASLAYARGRFADTAVELVERGDAMHLALGLDARSVRSGHDLATILQRRGRPDDIERARELLRDVVRVGTKIGMRPLVESATSALES